MVDLSFLPSESHRRVVAAELELAQNDNGVIGMALWGLLARGEARPDSDVEIGLLVAEGEPSGWEVNLRQHVAVERLRFHAPAARSRIEASSEDAYRHAGAQILFDPSGALGELKSYASDCLVLRSYAGDLPEGKLPP